MHRLENETRQYAWGSHDFIPALLGRPPAAEPEAELWLGAHPLAPSRLAGETRTLQELIEAEVAARIGAGRYERSADRPSWPAPLRELPLRRPAGSCGSYPRWSVNSFSSAVSSTRLVNPDNNPSGPTSSAPPLRARATKPGRSRLLVLRSA